MPQRLAKPTNMLLCVLKSWLMLVVMVLGVWLPVGAQTPGSASGIIAGKVVNPAGIALTEAEVIAREASTGLERKMKVNDRGDFVLTDLPPGSYDVTVNAVDCESPGVATDVRVSEVSRLTLVCGAEPEEEILIRAGGSRLFGDTASASLVSQEQIQGLPINRRVFTDFVVLNPRVREERLVSQGVFRSTGFSANGQSARTNNVQIDGFDNNDPVSGAYRSFFSAEAVREFQVVTDGYSAEFGRATSAVMNVVTRSGSNEFNGSLFGIFRNDVIAARNAFAPKQTDFEQDQFGTSIGGPIKPNRAYFFATGERQTIQDTVVVTIPERIVNLLHNRGYTWVRTGPQPVGIATSSILGRVDVDVTPQNRLTVRYNFAGLRDGAAQGFGGNIDRTFGGTLEAAIHDSAIRNVWSSASGKWVMETKLAIGDQNFLIKESEVSRLRLTGLATNGIVDSGHNGFVDHTRSNRVFQIGQTVSGFVGSHSVRFGTDFVRYGNQVKIGIFDYGRYTYSDLDLRYLGLPGDGFIGVLEAFEPALRTQAQRRFLNALAPLLPSISLQENFPDDLPLADIQIPASFFQGYTPTRPSNVDQNNLSVFVQDDWRMRDNLLVKFGLRLDHIKVNGFFDLPAITYTPRIGISWSPRSLPHLTTSANYGAYTSINPAAGVGANGTDAYEPGELDTDTARGLVYIAPDSLPIVLTNPLGFGRLTEKPSTLPLAAPFKYVGTIDRRIPRLPITHQASFKVSWEFTENWLTEIAYTWSRGNRVFTPGTQYNFPDPQTGQLPYPQFGTVEFAAFAGDSYFNSLTLAVERRLVKGWYFGFHYTFSKGIDNSGDFGSQEAGANSPAIPGFRRLDRALSFLDLRHRFVSDFRFESPWKSKALTGWVISGITTLESGSPFNLVAGVDLNRDGDSFGDRPLVNGVSLARNAGIRPGYAQVDLRLTRSFELGDTFKLDFFADVFNLFNRLNVRLINNTYPIQPDGSFNLPATVNGRYPVTRDRYTSAFAPRQFQVGFRLRF